MHRAYQVRAGVVEAVPDAGVADQRADAPSGAGWRAANRRLCFH